METLLQIDGAYGEGGGQLIRTALALSAMTGRDIALHNIRAGRAKPGLQPQHLTAVKLAADLCAAQVEGAAIDSTSLRFLPQGPVNAGTYMRDIGTAGAMALVLQMALIPLTHAGAPSLVRMMGGSHVSHAPSLDYLQSVYFSALRRMGVQPQLHMSRAGFYPRGGGEALLEVMPAMKLHPIDLTARGQLQRLTALITTSCLPEHVGERGAATVLQEIATMGLRRQLVIEKRDLPSNGAGAAVLLAAECDAGHAGFLSLGARGLPMERVAERACRDFTAWWHSEAACDEHLADQLVLPSALAEGESRWTTPQVTEHLRTVIWLVKQFVPVYFSITAQPGDAHLVTVRPQ